jgi:hypothetical protein
MEEKNFIICDTKNYKKTIDIYQIGNVSKKIILLLSDFVNYITEQIKNVENVNYNLFIIQRGFETIIHCFKLLLLYTKNLELSLYHSKKAYIYYVEFIGQIGYNNHSFLKLNSTDATLFVYKKTIFEINNEYRKNYFETDIENKHYSYLAQIIDLYMVLYKILISNIELKIENRKQQFSDISHDCNKVILNIYNNKNNFDINLENIILISYFIELLAKKIEIDNHFYLNIINYFIKKIKKNTITKKNIQNKVVLHKIQKYLDNMSHIKLINYIFAN